MELVTVAENCRVVPRSMLLLAGFRTIFDGVGIAGELLLPPPHPDIPLIPKDMDKSANRLEANRRIHPPRPPDLAVRQTSPSFCWKTFSVEAAPDLSKGRRQGPCLHSDAACRG